MAKSKRNVFYSTVQVRYMLTHELLEDRAKIKELIFDPIIENYNTAKETGDFSLFQRKLERSNEVFMISMLHYRDNNVCGVVSHGSPRMQRYLRQCNPETFDVKELVPDDGNVFEEYSFFAISITKMQMAYLSDSAVSSNIPSLVLSLFHPSVNVNYDFEERAMLDADIKQKIKNLGNNIVINGVIVGREEHVVGGMQSIATMQNALGAKFEARIKVRAKVQKKLTDEDIEIIRNNATMDEGFTSFTFADESNNDNEVIDVIKNRIRTTKSIELSDNERMDPNAVWTKLCASFYVG